jgi:hypothetical protein
MIRSIRVFGFLLIGVGVLVLLTWVITPLRALWPWFRALPLAIQIGIGVALLGLLVLMGSLIAERIADRERDRSLLEDRL